MKENENERNLDKSLDLLMAAIYTEIENIIKLGLKPGIRQKGKEHYGESGAAYSINKMFRRIESELVQAENNLIKFLYDLLTGGISMVVRIVRLFCWYVKNYTITTMRF